MDTIYIEAILSDTKHAKPAARWLTSHGITVDYMGTYSISCHCTKDLFSTLPTTCEYITMLEPQDEVVYL
jgi:hypothetical protein